MTSTPVTGADMIQNIISAQTKTMANVGVQDFKSFMTEQEQNFKQDVTAANDAKETKIVTKNSAPEENVADTEKPQAKNTKDTDVETKDVTVTETKEPTEKEVSTVAEAIREVVKAISDELEVSLEDIEDALETLGLPVVALLDNEMLPSIMAEICGADNALSIATNQDLYESLKEITETVETVVTGLEENLGIKTEELLEAIKKEELSTEQSNEDFSEVIDSITNENETEVIVSEENPEDTFEGKIEAKVSKKNETVKVSENSLEKTEETKMELPKELKKEDSNGQFNRNDSPASFAENLISKVTEVFNSNEEVIFYTDFEVQNIIDQMTEAIKVDISNEMSEVNLRLHPESLGSVSVKISANNEGVLTAEFTAQNDSVKAIIESQAIVLREALESKGVTVEAVAVTVESHQFERNLSDEGRRNDESGKERHKARRINLSEPELEGNLEDGDQVIKEMMAQNGNTIDYSA